MVRRNSTNRAILWLYLILSFIGLTMIFSASASFPQGPFSFLIKQGIFVVAGIFVVLITARLNLKYLLSDSVINKILITLLVILVITRFIIPPAAGTGAHGWIPIIAGFTIQPAEIAKVALILYYANKLASDQKSTGSLFDLRYLFKEYWLIAATLLMILIMPDLGNFLITFLILVFMFLSTKNRSWTIATFVILFAAYLILPRAAMLLPDGLKNYQVMRLITFLNPWEYLQTGGSQLVQSYYAIAHGGIFGVGIGNSVAKTGYLPEANTDFIMAVAAEEIGLIGVCVILILEAALIISILNVGKRSKSPRNRLIIYGLAAFILIQIFINLGGVIGIVPTTGVVFPFISYGGTSFLVLSIAVGIVLNIHRQNLRETRKTRSVR